MSETQVENTVQNSPCPAPVQDAGAASPTQPLDVIVSKTGEGPVPNSTSIAKALPEKAPIALDRAFGKIDVLSDVEQIDLLTCEEVISIGWQSFVDVGLALARIRDKELYRGEFDSFETYCREKWEYGRRQAYYLMSAAQLFRILCTKSALRKPEHETQLRPLLGLPPEQALAAWTRAVEIADGRKIRVRLVKAAVQELQLAHDPPVPKLEPRSSKAEKQRLINSSFGELLVLLSQKATHETLTAKLEALHGQVRALFTALSAKAAKPTATSA